MEICKMTVVRNKQNTALYLCGMFYKCIIPFGKDQYPNMNGK